VILLLLLVAATSEPASEPVFDEPEAAEAGSDLALWGFDLQLDAVVVSSTKSAQRASVTPAVVTVVSGDEIQTRGYRSIADVLRAVPGFYDVYDLSTHNFGVRGVNGGVRASGSVIKLMIDGHPVDFRPNTGNFFGEELVPIHLVERVEVIRGPASALYGANAYLAVVNVVTKTGRTLPGFRLGALALNHRDRFGGGGEIIGGGSGEFFDAIVGFTYTNIDRSGLTLPASSPLLASAGTARTTSGDRAQPMSALLKVSLDQVIYGKLELMASLQRLDTPGNFLDFGALNGGTRIAVLNQNYRLRYSANIGENHSITVSGHYLRGEPTPEERLDIGRSDYVLIRRVGAEGFGVEAEGKLRFFDRWNIVLGADYSWNQINLQRFDQLLSADLIGVDGQVVSTRGTLIPVTTEDRLRIFQNVGAYMQHVVELSDFSLTAGVRIDYHNIYGTNFSGRGGVVWAPSGKGLSLKLLYGSSFKAPTAEQLYSSPFAANDIVGNDELRAQNAHNFELAASYRLPKDLGEVSLNVFATLVGGRVDFITRGIFSQARNLPSEWLIGGEAEARVNPWKPLWLRLNASVARTVAQGEDVYLASLQRVTNPSFPAVQVHFIADYALPWAGLKASAEVSVIGPRSASQSNALANRSVYYLPTYVNTALVLSMPARKLIGDRDSQFSVRVDNVPNLRWADPGFNGVDVPNLGISATLWWVQQL
jgi:outer membrane receptor for ferrienterochelin and colicins